MASSALVPLADREHGTIYLQDGKTPASRATARVFTRRKGELVELPVWADPEKSRRLAQPLTAGRDGRLPGLISRRYALEVSATWRGRTVTTADVEAAMRRAEMARAAELDADLRALTAPRGTVLTVEIDATSGALDLAIVTRDYQPVFDADHDADVLNLTPGFGIDSNGVPYYDTTGPSAGEEAVLGVSQTLDPVLVSA